MIRLAAGIAIALAAPTIACAQPALTPPVQAQMAVRLWSEACAANVANPAGVAEFASRVRLEENPPRAASVLNGQQGNVWDASLGPFAQIALVLLDNGTCRVIARRGDAATAVSAFTQVLSGVQRPGLSVTKLPDRETVAAGINFTQYSYFVAKDGSNAGWAFIATTSASDSAPQQIVLTISQSQRPGSGL